MYRFLTLFFVLVSLFCIFVLLRFLFFCFHGIFYSVSWCFLVFVEYLSSIFYSVFSVLLFLSTVFFCCFCHLLISYFCFLNLLIFSHFYSLTIELNAINRKFFSERCQKTKLVMMTSQTTAVCLCTAISMLSHAAVALQFICCWLYSMQLHRCWNELCTKKNNGTSR